MHLLGSYDTESYQPPSFTYQAAATLQYSWYNVVMVTAYGTESNLIRDRAKVSLKRKFSPVDHITHETCVM